MVHPAHQIEAMAKSLQAFGWRVPVLIDAYNVLIAGHGRWLAAKRLGLAKVPAIRLEHLTPQQVKAYRIADNQLGRMSDWDDIHLMEELESLSEAGHGLEATGFTEEDMVRMVPDITDFDLSPKAAKSPHHCPECGHEF